MRAAASKGNAQLRFPNSVIWLSFFNSKIWVTARFLARRYACLSLRLLIHFMAHFLGEFGILEREIESRGGEQERKGDFLAIPCKSLKIQASISSKSRVFPLHPFLPLLFCIFGLYFGIFVDYICNCDCCGFMLTNS